MLIGTRDAVQNRVAIVQSGKDDGAPGAGYRVGSVSVNEMYDMPKTADVIVTGLNDLGHVIVEIELGDIKVGESLNSIAPTSPKLPR